MPSCLVPLKKEEILRDESKTDGIADIDYVLTTSELITMIKRSGLMFEDVEPLASSAGSGVIFGASGGVTEAVMRRLADKHSRSEMETIRNSGVRGGEGIKEIVITYQDKEYKAAVVSGLANAEKLIQQIESGECNYDFIGSHGLPQRAASWEADSLSMLILPAEKPGARVCMPQM